MTEEEKTTSNKPEDKKLEEIKSHLLSAGLEDYGFWWQEVAKKKAAQSEPNKPFRRGRIWS
jgi:cyanobactin cluster PatC/TenC/TruC protein